MKDNGSNLILQIRGLFEHGQFVKSGRRQLIFEGDNGGGFLIRTKASESFHHKCGEIIPFRQLRRIVGRSGAQFETLEPQLIRIDITGDAAALGLPAR